MSDLEMKIHEWPVFLGAVAFGYCVLTPSIWVYDTYKKMKTSNLYK